jgi:hypothetical protein
MSALKVSLLVPLLNSYLLDPEAKTIVIHHASKLVSLQDVTVAGQLLKKQYVRLNTATGMRTARLAAGGGAYKAESGDGDLHFCLGTRQLRPHIACELQNAKAWLSSFKNSVGDEILVSGFFRCMFEHPGFRRNDDAHIFEIHPVRAVNLGRGLQTFDVDIPEQKAIHTWTDPYPLNDQDQRIQVAYDKRQDTLTFTGMSGEDENYVWVSRSASKIRLNASDGTPAIFTFFSDEIGYEIQVLCLQGTSAARQLRQLKGKSVKMVGLRNIDLRQALKGRYRINLLAIDIQEA